MSADWNSVLWNKTYGNHLDNNLNVEIYWDTRTQTDMNYVITQVQEIDVDLQKQIEFQREKYKNI